MITDYATLQSTVVDWLNRADLAARVPGMIQNAEARLRRDPRVKQVTALEDFAVTEDGQTLPADFREIDSWFHAGPTYTHPIEIVGAHQIPHEGRTAGVPVVAAILDGKAYYGPQPDAEYPTRLSYYRRVVPLSDAATTNWLLEEHPDIYLYATLSESAPFLKDDERLAMWQAVLEDRLEGLHTLTQDLQFSGPMRLRPRTTIGG